MFIGLCVLVLPILQFSTIFEGLMMFLSAECRISKAMLTFRPSIERITQIKRKKFKDMFGKQYRRGLASKIEKSLLPFIL